MIIIIDKNDCKLDNFLNLTLTLTRTRFDKTANLAKIEFL
ncbi:hypothetical protein THERMOT_1787 [Bathymodiolus thermophilus thioautotrophic gill symbiont]|nr:hypothetical protein THERMOT_1787 [Bathymodiolus thermophilus thioautotrophic gill symbiont]